MSAQDADERQLVAEHVDMNQLQREGVNAMCVWMRGNEDAEAFFEIGMDVRVSRHYITLLEMIDS